MTPEILLALAASMLIAMPAFAGDLVIAGYGDSLTGFQASKWCGHVLPPESVQKRGKIALDAQVHDLTGRSGDSGP